MEQSGIASQAQRQLPFREWQHARAACSPACAIPGRWADPRNARRIARLPRALSDGTLADLDR
eukprot:4858234-Lingulodinium_polyedra.AAC.1